VLVHDEGRDCDSWRDLVVPLAGLGLRVLTFDLRGHGASDDPWEPSRAPADVLAALRFAKSQSARSLVLVGAGAGATAALVAAGGHDVRALVLLSPRAGLEGVGPDAVRESNAPKLIVVGGHGTGAPEAAAELYRRTIGWGLLESPPVEEQGTDLIASAWGEHVVEHMAAFLRDYL
jgi:pimeloyl-ACP methyl ester carboxylesterase